MDSRCSCLLAKNIGGRVSGWRIKGKMGRRAETKIREGKVVMRKW